MGPQGDFRDRASLEELQSRKLRAMLKGVLPANAFLALKVAEAGINPGTIKAPADLARLPLTTKAELLADQENNPPYGTTLTYPRERYCRLHQTSGTTGRPLCWLDTPASWQALLDCWDTMFRLAGVRPGDRLFFPFSFGPFLGFWTAFEAAARQGMMCLPGGGMSGAARLRHLLEHEATVVFCTPTYALRLAEVARAEGIDLAGSPVRALIVAGEPGGSIPATRARIESAWGARVFDHNGLTEVGPMGIECVENPAGLHLLEDDYIIEVLNPESLQPVPAGEIGELVVTNLNRLGSPVIRYRTGDRVRVDPKPCACGRVFLRLDGGILGRTDDMIHVRGNNVYPAALEGILHRFPEVAEYRVEVRQNGALAELRIDVEPAGAASADLAERIGKTIRDELWFKPEVAIVSPGTLQRSEMKAKRIQHKDTGTKS
jgi:phenylacetate-CoA ligase